MKASGLSDLLAYLLLNLYALASLSKHVTCHEIQARCQSLSDQKELLV